MSGKPTILALILARGGSKRLPRKNVLPLAGKPLIAYSIDAAKASGVVDRIVVSTDDPEIAEVSKAYGAEIPFLRPAELSGDTATSEDAIRHAIEWLKNEEGYSPDYLLLLQPTIPFRMGEDIRDAFVLLREKQADAVVSMEEFTPHPFAITDLGDGRVDVEINKPQPTELHLNGAIYCVKTSVFMEERTLYPTGRTYAYVMPEERSLDIDYLEDLKLAEAMIAAR